MVFNPLNFQRKTYLRILVVTKGLNNGSNCSKSLAFNLQLNCSIDLLAYRPIIVLFNVMFSVNPLEIGSNIMIMGVHRGGQGGLLPPWLAKAGQK
jgi:hypothetical protein